MSKEKKFEGEKLSDAVCERIAKQSVDAKGVSTVFLQFSRGKDSIATYLQLKKFFKRIIPIHLAIIPNLKFVNDSLEYYEKKLLKRKVIRLTAADGLMSLIKLQFQFIEDIDVINHINDTRGIWDFKMYQAVELVREKMNLPKVWTASGELMADSIFRRMDLKKRRGAKKEYMEFYPIYGYKPLDVIQVAKDNNISFPPDYLMSGRSLCGLPEPDMLKFIKIAYPEDYLQFKKYFPFIDALIARNRFRRIQQGVPV